MGIKHVQGEYDNILNIMQMSSLKSRRTITDLKILHKLLNRKFLFPDLNKYIVFNKQPKNTRKHLIFNIPLKRSNFILNAPIYRFANMANKYLMKEWLNYPEFQFKFKLRLIKC